MFDFKVIIVANSLCNHLGMDTISTSNAVAFVFEAVSKGLIKSLHQGPKLEFGNSEAVLSLIRQIAAGEGIGELMQYGTRWAANSLARRQRSSLCMSRVSNRLTMILEPYPVWPLPMPQCIAELAIGAALRP